MEELIPRIDPGLRPTGFFNGSVFVYRVEDVKGQPYILKFAGPKHYWGVRHLENEARILELVKDIPGVTHLVREYRSTNIYSNPILKEYFEGSRLVPLRKIDNSLTQAILEETLKELHSRDISNLELSEWNIVVSPDEESVKIVDLGHAVTKYKDINEMKRLKKLDRMALHALFA